MTEERASVAAARKGLCVWCTTRPATEQCTGKAAAGLGRICHHCHAALRVSRKCPDIEIDHALQVLKEDEAMKKKKRKGPPTNGNGAGEERIERARYEDKLPCKLDAADLPVRSAELAKVIRDREAVLEQKREVNAKYRAQLSAFDERLLELAEQIDGKIERKNVEVVEYLLPRTNEIQVVRTDTGEVVTSRTASAEELQEELPLEDEEEPDDADKGDRTGHDTEPPQPHAS